MDFSAESSENDSGPPSKKHRGNYYCIECDRPFTEKRTLLRHCRESKQHLSRVFGEGAAISPEDGFSCPACEKVFARFFDLRRHDNEVHKGGRRLNKTSTATSQFLERNEAVVSQAPDSQQSVFNDAMCAGDTTTSVGRNTLERMSSIESFWSDPLPVAENMEEDIEDFLQLAFKELYLNDTEETKLRFGASQGALTRSVQQCPVCLQFFHDAAKLLECLDSHAGFPHRIHICNTCEFGFIRKDHLQAHLQRASSAIRPSCGFRFHHACTGHHPVGTFLHERMDQWYLGQLALRAEKRAATLNAACNPALRRRWSINIIQKKSSSASLASSLNTLWTSPTKPSQPARRSRPITRLSTREQISMPHAGLLTEFHSAILDRDVGRVRELITEDVNVNDSAEGWGPRILPQDSSMLALSLERALDSGIPDLLLDAGAEWRFAKVGALETALSDINVKKIYKQYNSAAFFVFHMNGTLKKHKVDIDAPEVRLPSSKTPDHCATYRYVSPLHAAIEHANYRLANALVKHGAVNLNSASVSSLGTKLLRDAVSEGNSNVLSFWLEHGVRPDNVTDDQDPLICIAAGNGDTRSIELLLSHGADPNVLNCQGMSPLLITIGRDPPTNAQTLLEWGANIDSPSGPHGSALCEFVAAGNLPAVRWLITRGADIEWGQTLDRRPVYQAMNFGHISIVRELISEGARIDFDWSDFLVGAILTNNEAMVSFLLADCSIDTRNGPNDLYWSAFSEAIEKRHDSVVMSLLSHELLIELRTRAPGDNLTILRRAVRGGHYHLATYLMKHGLRFESEHIGQDDLCYAALMQHSEIVELLLSYGLSLPPTEVLGNCALCSENSSSVQLLLAHGFNPSEAGCAFPLKYSADHGYQSVVDLSYPTGRATPDGNATSLESRQIRRSSQCTSMSQQARENIPNSFELFASASESSSLDTIAEGQEDEEA